MPHKIEFFALKGAPGSSGAPFCVLIPLYTVAKIQQNGFFKPAPGNNRIDFLLIYSLKTRLKTHFDSQGPDPQWKSGQSLAVLCFEVEKVRQLLAKASNGWIIFGQVGAILA